MSKKNRYLITQSLLSSWQYVFKSENGHQDFLKTLNREPIQTTQAMLDGRQFENVVSTVNQGMPLDTNHKWHGRVMQTAEIVKDSAEQVRLSKDIIIDNTIFVLYGVLDNLKAGVIYDTKMSKTYHFGKYRDSPQHPMYFRLCPEAYQFTYVICNGKDVFQETYYPFDTPPIEDTIKQFLKHLHKLNLLDVYKKNWISKY